MIEENGVYSKGLLENEEKRAWNYVHLFCFAQNNVVIIKYIIDTWVTYLSGDLHTL